MKKRKLGSYRIVGPDGYVCQSYVACKENFHDREFTYLRIIAEKDKEIQRLLDLLGHKENTDYFDLNMEGDKND